MNNRPLIIAHRGASSEAEENTLEAVQLAIQDGADMIEMDLNSTKDQVLVLSHNDRLSLRHPNLKISKLTYEELREKTGVEFPRLTDVISQIPSHILINLDLKKTTMDLAIEKIISPPEIQKRIYFDSNNAFLLQRYEVFFPQAKSVFNSTLANPLNIADTPIAAMAIFFLALFLSFFSRLIFRRKLNQFFPDYVSLNTRLCSRKNVEFFHKLGIKVMVCPVNKEKNMRKFIDIGVDGIKTDRPKVLSDIVREMCGE